MGIPKRSVAAEFQRAKTHCGRCGGEYYTNKRGWRECRNCRRRQDNEYRKRLKLKKLKLEQEKIP